VAEGAAPTRTSEPDIAALGRRFSAPVRSVAARLADEEVAAAQIADALLRDDRDYGGEGLLPLQAREGERASVGRWLLRMAGLFDEEAVAQGPSEVIDGRLALLALARLDPGLDGLFRRTGFRRRLRRELKVAAEDVFLDWVLPPPRTGHVEAYAIAGAGGLVFGPAFSPDGSLLAAGGENGVAHIWDAGTGTELSALRGHEGNVFAPHFSPDGQLLASVGQDGTGRLWDVGSGTERAVLRGHEGTVYRQAFSPDGRLLATGGEDGTARLWDVISGTERAVLRGHAGTVHGLAFSPRGRLLLATLGVDDGTVRIWDVASESERAVLRGQEAAAYGSPSAPTEACWPRSRERAPTG
jgi:hypothetical protein